MIEIESRNSSQNQVFPASRLPVSVGRRAADCLLNREGVWDCHLVLSRDEEGWIVVTPHAEAAVFREGERLGPSTRLKNGDSLELGCAQLRFRISSGRQRSLLTLETLTWSGLLGLVLAQILLLQRF